MPKTRFILPSEVLEVLYKLIENVRKYILNISLKKTEVMTFAGIEPIGAKLIVGGMIIKQVRTFKCSGCEYLK
jgi:hypothetical protein